MKKQEPQEEREVERKALTTQRTITHGQDSPRPGVSPRPAHPSRCLSAQCHQESPSRPLLETSARVELIWPSHHCAWAGRQGTEKARNLLRVTEQWWPEPRSPGCLSKVPPMSEVIAGMCTSTPSRHLPPLLTVSPSRAPLGRQPPISRQYLLSRAWCLSVIA